MVAAVYVSNADSGDISVLRLDARTGELTPVQQVVVGGTVMPLALSPDARRLYAARRSEPLEVLSFDIDAKTGALTPIGAAPLPHSMAYIATDRSGRWLFSASYGGHLIAVSPIGADGVAQAARQVLPTGPNAHAIRADPSNRFVLATSLGGGVVVQMRFDAATGQLTLNMPAEMRPHTAASPRHFEFGTDARFVYLLGELDAAIDVLAFDAAAGTLRSVQTISALPPGFSGEPWAADLHLTPDGRFLYTSERSSSTLAMWAVNATSGELTLIGHVPTEKQPRGFRIDPSGRWLLAVGQVSNALSTYRIDPDSGRLSLQSSTPLGKNPNWVEIVELP